MSFSLFKGEGRGFFPYQRGGKYERISERIGIYIMPASGSGFGCACPGTYRVVERHGY